MKKHEIIFSIIKIPLDFLIIYYSFYIARNLREINDFLPGLHLQTQNIENQYLIGFALFGAFLQLLIFFIHGLYSIKISNSKIKEILDIIQYSIYGFLFFSIFAYFGKGVFYKVEIPRLVILFTFLLSMICIIFQRILLNNFQKLLLDYKIIEKRKMLLINNKFDEEITNILKDIKKANIYKIVGYLNKTQIENTKYKYLGDASDIEKTYNENKIDEILYIDSDFTSKEQYSLWDFSRILGLRYRYITNGFDVTKTNTIITLLNKIPVMEIKNTPIDAWARVIKRAIDLFLSIFLIILFIPLFLIVGILIKLEDPKGPIIYKNRRVGQNGELFNLFKFRYIKWEYCIKDSYGVNEKDDKALEFEKELIKNSSTRHGPLYKIKNDPRKTKVGKIIERYSIDELPQIFNVFIGNMSLVGPRPHQPREVEKYETYQKRVLTIKPGITGLAQVNGREKNKFEDEVALDITYIENWNFLLDVKIILKTFNTIINR